MIDQSILQYNFEGDAGYDLMLNMSSFSDNSKKIMDYLLDEKVDIVSTLFSMLVANVKEEYFYDSCVPKVYINGDFVCLLTDIDEVSRVKGMMDRLERNKEGGVFLPPQRVSCPELFFALNQFNNYERIRTAFDFVEPDPISIKAIQPIYIYGDRGVSLAHNEEVDLQNHNLLRAGLVVPRSGLADKHQLSVVNTPGLIDLRYRDNVGVLLENRGRDFHLFTNGARIAQLVIAIVLKNGYNLTPLKTEERGKGGFGSTGAKKMGDPDSGSPMYLSVD